MVMFAVTCSLIVTINDYDWGVDVKEQLQTPNIFFIFKVETVSPCLVPNKPVYDILDKLVSQFMV